MTVNEIFRQYGPAFCKAYPFLTVCEKKVISAISKCRTPELGGHLEVCEECGHAVLHYHSCRNRHCPQCQSIKKEQWIEDRKQEVFPFQYFHVVFTLPDTLNPIVYRNRKLLYDLLFRKVKQTLFSSAAQEKYFGARIGFFAILHTWGWSFALLTARPCILGKYTHRVAISNYRIIKLENDRVYFWYRDYKDNNRKKVMSLPVFRFMKRFILHVLPKRLVRIRYYGIAANRNKSLALQSCYDFFRIQQKVKEITKGTADFILELTGIDIHKCPQCGSRQLIQKVIPPVHDRAPPVKSA